MSKNSIEILYGNNSLMNINLINETLIKELKEAISIKYNLNINDVELYELTNDRILDDNEKINKIKDKKLRMNKIESKLLFYQMGNENTCFNFEFDYLYTTIEQLKHKIKEFFKTKMEEYNFNISEYEFYNDINDDQNALLFPDNSHKNFLYTQFKGMKYNNLIFNFIIDSNMMKFFPKINHKKTEIKNTNEEKENNKQIELRKNVQGCFKVIIQTYNHLFKEIEVNSDMTISELKDKIESIFTIKKRYQELIYIIYKLDDDSKLVKDYFIRPEATIFLRGFYFPIIFIDFYDKKNKFVLNINIAEKIKSIREELISRSNLEENYPYEFIFNGKVLEDEKFLIDFNVQKMQSIYFK